MAHLEEALDTYFCDKVLGCAAELQGVADVSGVVPSLYTPDQFGEELLQCIQGLTAAQVAYCNLYTSTND
jgi:hypothetical protein